MVYQVPSLQIYFSFILKMSSYKNWIVPLQMTLFLLAQFNFSSLSPRLFNLFVICRISSHLRSAQENVRKCIGISNYYTIATTLYNKCFQYAGVPLTELIKKFHYHKQWIYLLYLCNFVWLSLLWVGQL